MAVAFVRATYAEETALQVFLTRLFGYGKAAVVWKRGRYQCTIPRCLTSDEVEQLRAAVRVEHYNQV